MVTLWVYNLVLSYVKDAQDAEEIVQDTIMAAYKGIDRFDGRSSIKTWVYRIAINKSKEKLIYNSRLKRLAKIISINTRKEDGGFHFEPVDAYHPGVQLESDEKIEILFKGIANLPAQQKEALTFVKLEQLNIQETAELMGTTYKSVESLLSRAKRNLKSYLMDEGFLNFKKK